MEITGYDNVIFTDCLREVVANRIFKFIRSEWLGGFYQLPEQTEFIQMGDVPLHFNCRETIFCKNVEMIDHWMDEGYSLMETGEGPFGIGFRDRSDLHLQLNGVTEVNKPRVQPNYEATLLMDKCFEITLVSPDVPEEDPFSMHIFKNIISACTKNQ